MQYTLQTRRVEVGDGRTRPSLQTKIPAILRQSGFVFLQVAVLYVFAHAALKAMPLCHAEIDPLMLGLGHPMSFMEKGEDASIDTSTPWGLAQAYVDEGWDYLTANDGWNADGSMGGREFNRVPFSGDFSMTDSEGNSWTPYVPSNSPYEVSCSRWAP